MLPATIGEVAVDNSKILRIAGLSLAGFCAVSVGIDKVNVGPLTSQLAGFCGAFLGKIAARSSTKTQISPPTEKIPHELLEVGQEIAGPQS